MPPQDETGKAGQEIQQQTPPEKNKQRKRRHSPEKGGQSATNTPQGSPGHGSAVMMPMANISLLSEPLLPKSSPAKGGNPTKAYSLVHIGGNDQEDEPSDDIVVTHYQQRAPSCLKRWLKMSWWISRAIAIDAWKAYAWVNILYAGSVMVDGAVVFIQYGSAYSRKYLKHHSQKIQGNTLTPIYWLLSVTTGWALFFLLYSARRLFHYATQDLQYKKLKPFITLIDLLLCGVDCLTQFALNASMHLMVLLQELPDFAAEMCSKPISDENLLCKPAQVLANPTFGRDLPIIYSAVFGIEAVVTRLMLVYQGTKPMNNTHRNMSISMPSPVRKLYDQSPRIIQQACTGVGRVAQTLIVGHRFLALCNMLYKIVNGPFVASLTTVGSAGPFVEAFPMPISALLGLQIASFMLGSALSLYQQIKPEPSQKITRKLDELTHGGFSKAVNHVNPIASMLYMATFVAAGMVNPNRTLNQLENYQQKNSLLVFVQASMMFLFGNYFLTGVMMLFLLKFAMRAISKNCSFKRNASNKQVFTNSYCHPLKPDILDGVTNHRLAYSNR